MFIKVSYTFLDSYSICHVCFVPTLVCLERMIGAPYLLLFLFVKMIYYEPFILQGQHCRGVLDSHKRNVKRNQHHNLGIKGVLHPRPFF